MGSQRDGLARIHPPDLSILVGKPVVKGTRLSVEFLLGLFAAGWTEEQFLENYPNLTPEALRAVCQFAAQGSSPAPRQSHSSQGGWSRESSR